LLSLKCILCSETTITIKVVTYPMTDIKVIFSALSFVLVVCRSLATGQISSRYFFTQEPMPWVKGREYCQSHFVDLAVLSTEEEYSALLSAIPTNNASFWLGLHKQSSGWEWTDGEQLRLTHWYNYNHEGHCVSLEAMFEEKDKLLISLPIEVNS
uniref:C-type lectin domain-containing protein n=1 Tax=Poecilia mexicana TaxID=48701 RepID=A0A3B3XEV6_9TELE